MQATILAQLLLIPFALVSAQHGEDSEGTVMGPVAFLWPADRPWAAKDDNIGPCGSSSGPTNRTSYPLSQGSVALTVADEAWNVALRLAVTNDPKSQNDFKDQVVHNVSEVDPGHQCYKLDLLENIVAGTNATIQLEYWGEFEGENDGKNQSFFACADVTFVETRNFNVQVPCFNVTSEEFDAPTPTGSPGPKATGGSSSSSSGSAGGGGGLSTGAKAGIAVGSIIGGIALIAGIGFFLWRRGRQSGLSGKDQYELRAKHLSGEEGASTTTK